jgi:hypothetical protein
MGGTTAEEGLAGSGAGGVCAEDTSGSQPILNFCMPY